MSTAAVIAIAIAAVVLLGGLAFATLARRTDVRGAGALSGETLRRDRAARRAHPEEEVAPARTAADREADPARLTSSLACARPGSGPFLPGDRVRSATPGWR